MLNRRHFLRATALTASALAAPSILRAQDNRLVINSFGGAYEEIHRRLVITPFEEMTGTKVEVVTAYSADTLSQLRAQKEAPQFDVAHFSGGLETTAALEGLLSPIEPSELSNHDQMYEFAVAGISKGVGPTYSTAVIGLLYETNQISPAPTSWNDLLREGIGEHVLVTDAASNTYGLLGLLMMNHALGGTMEDLAPGFEFVRKLLDNGAVVVSKSPEIQQNFAQGSAWMAAYAQDYAYTLTKAGLPVRFVQPQEGAAFAPITVNLVANRPNREMALKFIDLSIRAEASAGWAEALRYSPTNKTVTLSGEVAEQVVYGEEAARNLVGFDPVVISDKRAGWNEEWKRLLVQ